MNTEINNCLFSNKENHDKENISCQVPNVSPIGTSLQILTLSDNSITNIPEEHLSIVTNLRQLGVKNNQLSSIANISGK